MRKRIEIIILSKRIERQDSDDLSITVTIINDCAINIAAQKKINGKWYFVSIPPELQSMVEEAYRLTLETGKVIKAIDKFYQQQ